tara:strand:+ start:114 stop:983 length:870 start_codon:yes stop_codon:yes gene_type:complete
MTVQFLHAPSATLAKGVDAHVTIEAEYGSVVAEGSIYTAAHHQAGMEHLPAPCNDSDIPTLEEGVVLVSHLDLDTFGGCLRTLGSFSDLFNGSFQGFWNLAHFVDVNGAHKLGQSGATEEDLNRLHSFWASVKNALPRFPRDRVVDITDYVHIAGDALRKILSGDVELLTAGIQMREATTALNTATFERVKGDVILRVTDDDTGFCNHLYSTTSGEAYKAIAAYNKDAGSITISLADAIDGVSCRTVMQDLFGSEAGGHDGIAGSPREQFMTYHQFESTADSLSELIGG